MLSNFTTDPSATFIENFRGEKWMNKRSTCVVLVGDEALDSVGCERVGVLKIDVEGGELEVLRGLQKYIGNMRPLVICAVLSLQDIKSVGDLRTVRQRSAEQLLGQLAYTMFRIEPSTTIRRFEGVPGGTQRWTDYFYLPMNEWRISAPACRHSVSPSRSTRDLRINRTGESGAGRD